MDEIFGYPMTPVGAITSSVHVFCNVNLVEVVVNSMHRIVHGPVGIVDITRRISEMKSVFRFISSSDALLMFWSARYDWSCIAYIARQSWEATQTPM